MSRACLLPFVVLLGVSSSAGASPLLRVDGPWFRDQQGAVVLLRGVNAAGNSKVPPFRPLTDPDVFAPLEGWGMNVVRLLFTWEAYEPQKGVYDESYLDYYVAAVEAAERRNVFVIVDFHQDAYSRFSLGGCGEGFPSWTLPWWIIKATPNNGASCHTWGATMIIDVVMHLSWNAFHRDETGARSRFVKMTERVAKRLASHDMVIGYDMMNEPWGDEPTDLKRLHADVGAAIRRSDPDAILFVSPHALISAGGKSALLEPGYGNLAYAPHFYDGAVITLKVWLGNAIDGPFDNMRSVARAWNVPLLVGEFGGAATTANGAGYVRENYRELDETFASGTQWSFTPGWTPTKKDGWNDEDLSIIDGAGNPRATFVPRPYPRRISGTPGHFYYDDGVSVELSWDHAVGLGDTEIYLPVAALFGAGTAVEVETDGGVECALVGDVLRCNSAVAGPKLVRVVR